MARATRLLRSAVPALVLVLALGAAGSQGAERGGSSPAVRASAASGSLSLANSRGNGAIFSATGMAPGRSTSGEVTITNNGSLAGGLALAAGDVADTPGIGGGRLSERLELVVLDVGGVRTVYSGPMAALGRRELGTMAPGEARTYRFTATLPDGGVPLSALGGDNAYQGATLTTSYVWTATAAEPPDNRGLNASLALRVAVARRQPPLRRRQLVLYATCNEVCSLTARAKLGRRSTGRSARKAAAPANGRVKLVLRLSRKSARKLARALHARRGARLTVAVKATDAAGHSAMFKRALRLKQVRRGARTQIRASWDKPKKRSGARR
jgi:hypothetical protein